LQQEAIPKRLVREFDFGSGVLVVNPIRQFAKRHCLKRNEAKAFGSMQRYDDVTAFEEAKDVWAT
jgi:hypothetical protein